MGNPINNHTQKEYFSEIGIVTAVTRQPPIPARSHYPEQRFTSRKIGIQIKCIERPHDTPTMEAISPGSELISWSNRLNVIQLAIGSSFTADPLRLPLQQWFDFLGRTAEIAWVPYGQMLMHLVDPNSPWFKNNGGFNVLLFRPSDLVRNSPDTDNFQIVLDDFCAKWENAARQWTPRTLVILVSPQSQIIPHDAWLDLEPKLLSRLKASPNVEVLRDEQIFSSYRCPFPLDPFAEQLAHIPWTDAASLSVASAIARHVDSNIRPPLKAIIVDCDNTLWQGVCGEDGPAGIRIESRHQNLQNILVQQRAQGRLICLCSKNNPADVWSVFETHSDMLLKRDHITAAMINWSPKSHNLLQLSKELNLAPDSFLFLDDSPLEIGEVRANAPDVNSLLLSTAAPEFWNQQLLHLWLLDGSPQTAEDIQRAQMYRDESQRSSLRAQSQSLEEFLHSLDLQIEIRPLAPEDEARADQLLQRTNQFNMHPTLRALSQLQPLSIEHELEIRTVRTRDRFGDYGLVGLLIYHCEGTTLHLDHLVLSCRALGRAVEVQMLQYLARIAEERLKQFIEIDFEASSRNQPAYTFLCQLSHQATTNRVETKRFVFDAADILKIDPIAFAANQKGMDDTAVVTPRSTNAADSPCYQKISELDTAEKVESFLRESYSRRLERTDGVELPRTQLERQVCVICQDILYLNDIGLSDSFRELGCSSLQFVRICSRIHSQLSVTIAIAETFALATVRDLVQLLESRLSTEPSDFSPPNEHSEPDFRNRQTPRQRTDDSGQRNGHEIAIIGMAGRFPGADDVRAFWQNLVQGIESIETLADADLNLPPDSPLRTNPNLVRRASYLKNADQFDARFFGVFPKEAAAMDPQHRLLLEECYHALEDAGYIPDQIVDSVGVFAGCYMDTYVLSCLETHPEWIQGLANSFHGGDLLTELGNDKDYLATRISFLLNLRGPALTIQTACSTSLVAIIQACQSLLSDQCRMALAGGVTLKFPQKRGYLYTDGGMVSPEGKCRTFDANAKGTIFGEGVAAVVLKRLDDAIQDGDSIYAVLKGWGINNDGRSKAGYTAPSIAGQSEAILLAHQHARITADSIQYVEAHGTGTALGDPIEVEALTRAFRKSTDLKQYCRIGSAKSNIGHLDVAAGVCGLIKTSLALRHELIPPSLNFENPNPNIDFANSPFVVNTQCTAWPKTDQPSTDQPSTDRPSTDRPRRAGLSSFGVGGTNAHVIIEEAPCLSTPSTAHTKHILSLSARSLTALDQMKSQLMHWLEINPTASIADVCYTLSIGRKKFNYSWSAIVSNNQEAIAALKEPTSTSAAAFTNRRNVPVAFAFPGQGSQHTDMGYQLYQNEPIFAEAFDQCTALLLPHLGFSLKDALFSTYRSTSSFPLPDVNETIVAQPGIFAVSYATARWLESLGIRPSAMLGHSVGEFVAACLSDIFSLEDALKLIAFRAQMMQRVAPGHMLAVRLGEAALLQSASYKKYESSVSLAAVNSPHLTVLSGDIKSIESIQYDLESAGVVSKILRTSHAFHSSMMDGVVEPLFEQLRQIKLNRPTRRIVSTVTGNWLSDEEAMSPEYWAKHLRETVRFSTATQTLLASDYPIILELGPGQTVATLIKQHSSSSGKEVLSLYPHLQEKTDLCEHALRTLSRIWQAGADIRLSQLYASEFRQRLNLPGYPFERQRYWFDQLITCVEPAATATTELTNSLLTTHTEANGSAAYLDYAQNSDYSAIVQQVIRQQLEIMAQQLKFWHP